MHDDDSTPVSPSEVPADAPVGDVEIDSKRRFTRGTIVLGVLLATAVGGLTLMYFRSGPAQALGGTANKDVTAFLGDGKKNVASMRETLSATDKVVEQFRQFPAAQQIPLEDLQKNPFSARATDERPAETNRDAEIESAKKRAGQLKLSSIMFSETSRSCMINGKFRVEGDAFEGFTVDKIEPGSVIVKTNNVRLRLQVKQ